MLLDEEAVKRIPLPIDELWLVAINLQQNGLYSAEGLYRKEGSGRPRKLEELRVDELERLVLEPASSFGYETDLWTVGRLHHVICAAGTHPYRDWQPYRHQGWGCIHRQRIELTEYRPDGSGMRVQPPSAVVTPRQQGATATATIAKRERADGATTKYRA